MTSNFRQKPCNLWFGRWGLGVVVVVGLKIIVHIAYLMNYTRTTFWWLVTPYKKIFEILGIIQLFVSELRAGQWHAAACCVSCCGRILFLSLLSERVFIFKSVPYPSYSERVYILHRRYFLAIASHTFVFAWFSIPLGVLGVAPANFFCATHMRVCLTPQCSLFPIFRREFSPAA